MRRKIFLPVCAAVILLAEIFIFNFASFHLSGGGYEPRRLTASETAVFSDKVVLEFTDVGIPVGTIALRACFDSPFLSYAVDWTDESCSEYHLRSGIISGEIIRGDNRSSVIPCHFSGDVSKLKIYLYPDEGADFDAGTVSVSVNEPVPFRFSALRCLILFAVMCFIYFLTSGRARHSTADEVKSISAFLLCGGAVITALALSFSASGGLADFRMTTGNQMTKELVDAFLNGTAKLDVQVPDWLRELDNPYDWSQRGAGTINFLWDHVYYDGSVYSYYGIAPVILLFIPYKLITGFYFPSVWAVFLFGAGGLVFLTLLYREVCRRFFRDIPLGMYVSGLVMLYAVCGIWYCFPIPNFYEIAQSSGFFFVTMGGYFLVSSGMLRGKVSLLRTCLSAVSFSLGVMCRPTLALWCVAAVAFTVYGFVRCFGDTTRSFKLKYILASAVPFVVIGSAQMIYNYVRFGLPTEFGIQYSLTINDFTASQYHTRFAAIGFYNFLAAVPSFSTEFPFIHSSYSTLDVNGYYFTANTNAVGIFFRALPMFFCFRLPSAVRMIKTRRVKVWFSSLWMLCTAVIPCGIIFSIWESGYGVRYCVDFYWQMLFGALIVMFMLYRGKQTEEGKAPIYGFTVLSSVLSAVVCFALVFSYLYPSVFSDTFLPVGERFVRLFEFWKW